MLLRLDGRDLPLVVMIMMTHIVLFKWDRGKNGHVLGHTAGRWQSCLSINILSFDLVPSTLFTHLQVAVNPVLVSPDLFSVTSFETTYNFICFLFTAPCVYFIFYPRLQGHIYKQPKPFLITIVNFLFLFLLQHFASPVKKDRDICTWYFIHFRILGLNKDSAPQQGISL